jgi:hypothetical protein
MNLVSVLAGIFFSFLVFCPVQAATIESYFPTKNLGRFLSEKFDLATVRSSFGPRRTSAKRTFADFEMKPSQLAEDSVVFLSPGDWLYELRIVARGDFNRDGIEDLKVCFVDRALNGGTYDTAQGLLLTRYSGDAYVIALGYSLEDGVCLRYAK